MVRARVPSAASFAIAALVVASLPLVVPSFLCFQLAYAGAYAIAILGLLILTGFNGQISLGHGAFMAIGGYCVAIGVTRAGWPPEAAMAIAAVTCAVFGAGVGIVALRLSGAYLALATFALAVAVAPVLKRFKEWTGGATGIALPTAHAPGPLANVLDAERWIYYETWLLAGVLFAVSYLALQGRFGRALRALRDNEIAAVSFGIDPSVYKTLAFAWSAACAGLAGALIASATAFVSPDTYALQLSLTLLIGAVLGGLIIEFLPLWTQTISQGASSIVYGVALIVVMIVVPGGIAGALRRASLFLTRPFRKGSPEKV